MKSSLIKTLQAHQRDFHAVVPFDPLINKLFVMDLTKENKLLNDDIVRDTNRFSAYVSESLYTAGATYGIGGYAEHRTIYGRSKLFDGSATEEEPRRLHLGTDIWGKVNTAVRAPLDGIVHSFGFNDGFGDYGVTIILSHLLDNISFYTLYGHLSLSSIKNMQEGDLIREGTVFAEFGIHAENGHWPPHLHFQLIRDLQGWKGDYPGVCRYSEREQWLFNCPDPDLVLQLNRYI